MDSNIFLVKKYFAMEVVMVVPTEATSLAHRTFAFDQKIARFYIEFMALGDHEHLTRFLLADRDATSPTKQLLDEASGTSKTGRTLVSKTVSKKIMQPDRQCPDCSGA